MNGKRIRLDFDNELRIDDIAAITGRSPTSIVNELLRKIEIVVPAREKIMLDAAESKKAYGTERDEQN